MDISKRGSQSSAIGSAEYSTGTVRIDAPFAGVEPARISGATVTLEPGAHTGMAHPSARTESAVDWMERVTDDQYLSKTGTQKST